VNANAPRDVREGHRLGEMLLDERARLVQPRRRRTVPFAGDAPRRLGQDPERNALDREERHIVAHPEFAVQPVREVDDESAPKRRR